MTRAPAPHRMIDILARETVVHYAPVPRHLGEAELVPGRCALIGDQFVLIAPAEEMLWLNGSVYAAIASIHGLLPIHASAVAYGGAAHAFTGPSGADKSTLVAALGARRLPMLTGASGAGKSTLADVLGGLLGPDGGTLRIDGFALDPAQRRAWRKQVGYVQQDPVLLSGSVRGKLLWAAPEATDAALQCALEYAAASFAFALPGVLDTLVGDGGRALSGGERQRLMLARALLRRPALLILDEATSALDAENEAQIATALVRLKGPMAVLVIAHRGALSAIADRTYTLAAGRMVKAAA